MERIMKVFCLEDVVFLGAFNVCGVLVVCLLVKEEPRFVDTSAPLCYHAFWSFVLRF